MTVEDAEQTLSDPSDLIIGAMWTKAYDAMVGDIDALESAATRRACHGRIGCAVTGVRGDAVVAGRLLDRRSVNGRPRQQHLALIRP